jgi:hypothetical protein
MISCRQARDLIVSTVSGRATDVERLRLEDHLAACAACSVERGRWGLVGKLRELPHPTLGAAAQARVLASLVEGVERTNVVALPNRRSVRPVFYVVGAAAAAAAIFVAVFPRSTPRVDETGAVAAGGAKQAEPARATTAGDEGRVLREREGGAVAVAGATVRYPGGSAVRVHPSARQVDLLEGEVDVDVPVASAVFRVLTPRYVAELRDARLVARVDGAKASRGRARLLDRREREVATVDAGQAWTAPAELPALDVAAGGPGEALRPVAAGPIEASPGPNGVAGVAAEAHLPGTPETAVPSSLDARLPQAPAAESPVSRDADRAPAPHGGVSSDHRHHAPSSRPAPSSAAGQGTAPPTPTTEASRLLGVARGELAQGHVDAARRALQGAIAAHPTSRERAAVELLQADALLVEKRPVDAIAEYRGVAGRWAALPEGETAAFARAQLLWERGATDATAALEAYLARYPNGRFAREAKEHLDAGQGARHNPAR